MSLIVDIGSALLMIGLPKKTPIYDVSLGGCVPRSLFDGVNDAVCKALGIANLRHRSALHELGCRSNLPHGSVAAALDMIGHNWVCSQGTNLGSVSKENWRWCAPQTFIGSNNRSPEVILERAIASACLAAGRTDWANQVPIASGVVHAAAERRRAIDLVHMRDERHFEFIELKIASDTPLFAAFEIISYVGVWLLSKKAGSGKALLEEEKIDARVLAPIAYYAPFELKQIEQKLNDELRAYGEHCGTKLSFAFEVLPDDFEPLPRYEDDRIFALIDGRRLL